MTSQIACKLKNSFAIDNKQDLYSWGSYESGILGNDDPFDIKIPTKINFELYGEELKVEALSLGHFHAAAICEYKNYTQINFNQINENSETSKVLKDFRDWFKIFIYQISDFKTYMIKMLKKDESFKNVKYTTLRECFIESFIEFLKINKKDSFNMRSFYESNLKTVLGVSNDDSDIPFEKLENIFPSIDRKPNLISIEEKNILRFIDFLQKTHDHLKSDKQLHFFIRFVTNFKKNITDSDIQNVLEYAYSQNKRENYRDIRKETTNIFNSIYNQLKNLNKNKDYDDSAKGKINNQNKNFDTIGVDYKEGSKENLENINFKNDYNNNSINFQDLNNYQEKTIPIRYFIDAVCESEKGKGLLFTWGVNCDGRLGYKIIPDYDEENFSKNLSLSTQDKKQGKFNNAQKINTNYIMELSKLQLIPRMVFFEKEYKIESVACGYNHTLALTLDGKVFSWGNNKYGCLGFINFEEEFNDYPKMVDFINDSEKSSDIKSIGAGMYYSVAICKEKHIYTWGCGNNGRLGHGNEHSLNTPRIIRFFLEKEITVKSFSCGDTHIGIISNNDTLYTWGSGTYGKLGHGNLEDYNTPIKVEALKNSKIDIISCGSNDTIAVTSDLKVFSWGKNSSGMLGTSQLPDRNILVPTLMNLVIEDAKLGIVEVSVGSNHVLIRLSNGDLYTCGNTLNGISGIPNQKDKIFEPKKIPNMKCLTEEEDSEDYKNLINRNLFNLGFTLKTNVIRKAKFIFVTCSQDNTAFLTQNGDLFLSGEKKLIYSSDKMNYNLTNSKIDFNKNANIINETQYQNMHNNLGNESTNMAFTQTNDSLNRGTPGLFGNQINSNSNKNSDLGTPGFINLEQQGINNNSENVSKSRNNELNNFNLNTITENEQKLIRRIAFNQKVSYIALSKKHAILVSEYKAYSWGKNENGILGLGDKKDSEIQMPSHIKKLPSNISMVCCSDSHSMALTMNGEIYSFGLNTYGKLGIGSMTKYMIFITKGESENTEKGIDLPIEYEPQLVKDVSFAYFIACGNNHSACIMKNEETKKNCLYTWGSGYAGKLANNDPSKDVSSPQLCIGKDNTHFIQVTCGDEFTLALANDDTLYGAGKNIYLSLNRKGDKMSSSQNFSSTLRSIPPNNNFKFISSSNHYSVVLDKHGKMWGFGKIFREKLELDEEKKEIKCLDKMKFVACGQNHFAAFSEKENNIYTWGSNSYMKCGQNFLEDVVDKIDIESKFKFVDIPRRLKLDNFEKLDVNNENDENDNNYYDNGSSEEESNKSDNEYENQKDNNNEKILKNENDIEDESKNELGNINKIKDDEKNLEEIEKLEDENNIKKKGKENAKKRGLLQLMLLKERPEQKNAGLIQDDMKLVKKFYETLANLINNLRNNESNVNKEIFETENNILKFINLSDEFKIYKNYNSNIPKIINMNFQIYENFLNIIQQHPCNLAKLLNHINNKKTHENIIRIIFGRSPLLLNNKRINNIFLGLWNNIFSTDNNCIASKNKIEESSSYKIYKLILNNSEQNLEVIREVIAEVFVFYVNEICLFYEKEETKGKNVINNDSNLSFVYKEILGQNQKLIFKHKAEENICSSILNYFGDLIVSNNENNSNNNKNTKNLNNELTYTKYIIWIFKHLILKKYNIIKKIKIDNEIILNETFYDCDFTINDHYFSYISEIEESIISKNNKNKHCKINKEQTHDIFKISIEFNKFLFFPFVELLKEIKYRNSDTNLKEIDLMEKKILSVIEKFKKQYIKVYNLYKLDHFHFKKNYINDLLSNDSPILGDILSIFENLCSKNNNDDPDSKNVSINETLENMNAEFCLNIKNFKWDFTFNSLTDMIKTAYEYGNYKITIPLTVEDLINLQNYFLLYYKSSSDKDKNEINDPVTQILNILTNFKLGELENTSSIRNFVINLEIKPLTFLFDFSDSCEIFKCPKCLLPLHNILFSHIKKEENSNHLNQQIQISKEKQLDEVIYGKDWNCNYDNVKMKNKKLSERNKNLSDSDDENYSSLCRGHIKQEVKCLNAQIFKKKSDIITKYDLFKKYHVIHNNKLLNLYEEVLYILPKMSQEDDTFKIMVKEKDAIKLMNFKDEEWKVSLLDDFMKKINFLSSQKGYNEKSIEKAKKNILEELNNLLEVNLKSRKEHNRYAQTIYDLIEFMKSSVESLKTKYGFFEKEVDLINQFIRKGSCNQSIFDRSEKAGLLQLYQQRLNKYNNERKFHKFNVNSLINDKVIDNVEMIKDGQSNFNQKSYLVFSKTDEGYNIKLCFRETKRKYIICGLDNQEFIIHNINLSYEKIAELRRTAKNNPTFTDGEIRFNVFYLVRLLNSFENINQ